MSLNSTPKTSVHIQNFPINFFKPDSELTEKMDATREICSAISSIRKRFNLRARLPLSKLTIIGENALDLESYKKFILEEGNVKKIILDPNFTKETVVKIDILFEKCGKKFGKKMPEIVSAIKSQNWKKLSNGSILAGGEILSADDFIMRLTPTFEGNNFESIGTKFLIILDTTVNEALEMEGLARDFIRIVQNQRKEKAFEVNDKITLFYEGSERFQSMLSLNENYIKEQCLIKEIVKSKEDTDFILADLEDAHAMIKIK